MLLSAAVPLQTDPAAVPHWGGGGAGRGAEGAQALQIVAAG